MAKKKTISKIPLQDLEGVESRLLHHAPWDLIICDVTLPDRHCVQHLLHRQMSGRALSLAPPLTTW